MKIFVLTAEHFEVAGLVLRTFATMDGAVSAAVEVCNQILSDTNDDADKPEPATAVTWEAVNEWLQDYHGAAHCYVEICFKELEA